MIKHKHISFLLPGIFAMIGMPLMLMIFFNFKATQKLKCMEINYPSSKLNKQLFRTHSEFDTVDYNHPKGHFYNFSFSKNECYHPLEKTKLYSLLKNKPKEFDGFHIDLKNIKTYSDYVFIYNQMLIHGFATYFDYNDNFYCYYNGKSESLYRKKAFKRKVSKIHEIPFDYNFHSFSCGYIPYHKELTFKEKFNQAIQPHITYWYFWLLYFITAFYSIKKLKSIQIP